MQTQGNRKLASRIVPNYPNCRGQREKTSDAYFARRRTAFWLQHDGHKHTNSTEQTA
jgi:hypothetical protein